MNLKRVKSKYIIGIDEAGRGPIAGPLSLAGVIFKRTDYLKYLKRKDSLPKGIDSKKMSEKNREVWFKKISLAHEAGELRFEQVFVSEKFIDKKGMSFAIKFAIKKLLVKSGISAKNLFVMMDGGLKAPSFYNQVSIIKGDEKEKIIGLASVVAKVKRDRLMIKYSAKFPEYGFERHKGYGTREHYKKIKKYGISPIHRLTYLKSLQ